MNDLPSDLDRLLDAERGPVPSAPPGARQRVLSRVQSTLGLPAASPAASPAAAAAVPGAARWVSVLFLGVAASALVFLIARSTPPGPLPVAAQPSPAAPVEATLVAPAPAGPLASPLATAAPQRRSAIDRPPSGVVPAPVTRGMAAPDKLSRPSGARAIAVEPDSDLEAERTLLDLARDALRRLDTAAALDVTRQHQRRFPTGQLTEERESLAIRVLVSAHQRPAAEARATAFRQRFPHSIFLPAVDAVLR